MATTTPIPESILADVATKLALITVANSFRTTVATVTRQFNNPEKIGAGKHPSLSVYGEKLDFEIGGIGSSPKQIGVLRFKVQGILKEFTNPATEINDLIQDVREKLYEDRSRGGYADNTFIPSVELGGEPFGGNFGSPPFVAKPFVGFQMEVEVNYQEAL